ncbi:MAG: hypothetical protein R2770_12500 [Acidimicrobiales bacterium]
MSFDLYFVERPKPGAGWGDVMDGLEAAAAEDRDPTAEDLELWDRIAAAVLPVVPEAELFEQDRSRLLDDGNAVQLHMAPGEISLNTPYWFEGEQAKQVIETLRTVAMAIENATGLVAYDPQADMAFLDGGAEAASQSFDQAHHFIRDELGARPPDSSKRPWWALWKR